MRWREEEPDRYDSETEPHPIWAEFLELLRYRSLLWNLTRRDISVRYRRTWLGIVWVMLNPVLTAVVLVTVFEVHFRSDLPHYGVYVLSGLLAWTIFSEASSGGMTSLFGHAQVINKVHAPPSVFVISAVVSATFVHLFDAVPLITFAVLDGVSPQAGWLLLPIPLLQTAVFSAGVALLLASFTIYFTDVVNIYQLVLRIGFFMTPIFFPLPALDQSLAAVVLLNPVTFFVQSVRSVIFDGYLSWAEHVLPSSIIAVVALAGGWYIFTRVKREISYRA